LTVVPLVLIYHSRSEKGNPTRRPEMKSTVNATVAVAIYVTTWLRSRFVKGHAAKYRLWAECERKLSR
jgi:hypothetical protein